MSSLHLADTLEAGDGLCDEAVARAILAAAPAAIENLIRLGVPFDRDGKGNLLLGLEAAHSRRRIVHAGGDSSGREIMRALTRRVRETPSITLIERVAARQLLVEDGRSTGVLADTHRGPVLFAAIASSSRPAASAGFFSMAPIRPGRSGRASRSPPRPAPSWAISNSSSSTRPRSTPSYSAEARSARRCAAKARSSSTRRATRFMADVPGAELAPRDVVSRAVWRRMAAGHRVFLDARVVPDLDFARRFPAITGFCHAAGIDPGDAADPDPARRRIITWAEFRSISPGAPRSRVSGPAARPPAPAFMARTVSPAIPCSKRWSADALSPKTFWRPRLSAAASRLSTTQARAPADPAPVRKILSRAAGVLRDGEALREAAAALLPLASADGAASDPALVGLMIVIAALRRRESRGAHARTDFPAHAAQARRTTLRLGDALDAARELVPEIVA